MIPLNVCVCAFASKMDLNESQLSISLVQLYGTLPLPLRRIHLTKNERRINFVAANRKTFSSSFLTWWLALMVAPPNKNINRTLFQHVELWTRQSECISWMTPPTTPTTSMTSFFLPRLNCNCCLRRWKLAFRRFRSHYFRIETKTDYLIGRNRFAWMTFHRSLMRAVPAATAPFSNLKSSSVRWKSISHTQKQSK